MGGLHDQIHIQPGCGEGFKQLGCHTGAVGYVGQRQHSLLGVEFSAIHWLAQLQAFAIAAAAGGIAGEKRAGLIAPARAHHQGHAVVAGNFHGPWVQHGGAEACQFQHLVAGDGVHQLGIGHLAGVGGEHTGYIGVDLTGISAEGCR